MCFALNISFQSAGERSQWLRAWATFLDGPVPIPSNHLATHNQFRGTGNPPLASMGTACTWYTDTHAGKTPICIKYVLKIIIPNI